MGTMKSYTDLEQSKKLAEILPVESADMYRVFENNAKTRVYYGKMPTAYFVCKPCWSLASLLGVLPYCPDLSKHTDGKWYITTYPNDVHTCLMAYDNPVDACVEMVEKLNELNLL